MPTGDVAVLRWVGTANYELAYHGKIVIMDTFCERPARTAALGFTVGQVREADVTFPSGFTIVWFDSVGNPNAEERQLAGELAPIDVAIFPWTPHPIAQTQPLFMKIRDELPGTKFIEPLYRSAICVNTSGAARGVFTDRSG